jgi:hypothetical protein
MHQLPDHSVVQVKIADRTVPGVWVKLRLEVDYKNPFISIHGPSDEHGLVTVDADSILSNEEIVRSLFLMDYGSIRRNWTGEVTISPMNREDLESAIAAMDSFDEANYPRGRKKELKTALEVLERLGIGHLSVQMLGGFENVRTLEREAR